MTRRFGMLCIACAMVGSFAAPDAPAADWFNDPIVLGQVKEAVVQAQVEAEARAAVQQKAEAAQEDAKQRLADRQKQLIEMQERLKAQHEAQIDREGLKKITLAENPTRPEVRQYVLRVLRTADKITRRTNTDPQVAMLRSVPDQHFDVLLDDDLVYMRGHTYIRYALTGDKAKKNKAAIIEAAATHSWLISVIASNQWTDEAGPSFVKALNNDPLHASTTIIRYAIKADGPAVRDALIERLIAGRSRSSTYNYLKQVPGDAFELDTAVALAWERVRDDPAEANEKRGMQAIAMQHGHVDAIDATVEMYRRYAERLNNPKLSDASKASTERMLRQRIVDHFEFNGDINEFYSWYDRVKDDVQWDRVARKYCVPVLG